MNEAKKHRIKAFLWDQFIRPVYAMADASILKIALLVFLFVAIIIKLHPIFVYVTGIILAGIFFYEIYKYYQSGEFMYNYRKYKHSDYKRATKAFKKEESKSLNTLNNLNKDEEIEETRANKERMGAYSSETGEQEEI